MKRIIIKTFNEISPKELAFAFELGYESNLDYKNKIVELIMED